MSPRSNRQIPPHSFRVYPADIAAPSGRFRRPIRQIPPAYPADSADALGSALGSGTRFNHQRGSQALHHDQPWVQNHKVKTTRSNPAGHKTSHVAEALDDGWTQRALAEQWINPDTGNPYAKSHVVYVQKSWREFGHLGDQDRPRFNVAYNSDEVRGKGAQANRQGGQQ